MAAFRRFDLASGLVISLFMSSMWYAVILGQKTSTDDSESTCSNTESQVEKLTDEVNDMKIYMAKIVQQLDEVIGMKTYMTQMVQQLGRLEGRLTGVRDCSDVLKLGNKSSGIYTVYINGSDGSPIDVYCDMTTDGGGWTVFQRRQDGSVDFYRNWNNYSEGFGNLTGEFWLGNDNIHSLTASRQYELRVDLADFDNNTRYAEYSNFKLGGADDKYRLGSLGTYSGNAGDSLSYHVGIKFSTFDDNNDGGLCTTQYQGGWWYGYCHHSNLNGPYLRGSHTSYADGVEWYTWTGFYYSLKFTEMKIRPADV